MITEYEVYKIFHALYLHFTTKYDFFKYKGSTPRLTRGTYNNQKQKYFFENIAHKYKTQDEVINYFVFVLRYLDFSSKYIASYANLHEEYISFKGFQERLEYEFEKDLKVILDFLKSSNKRFSEMLGPWFPPDIIRMNQEGQIFEETIIILNRYIKFFKNIDKEFPDFDVWENLKSRYDKYKPFVNYDERIIKNLIRQYLLDKN